MRYLGRFNVENVMIITEYFGIAFEFLGLFGSFWDCIGFALGVFGIVWAFY